LSNVRRKNPSSPPSHLLASDIRLVLMIASCAIAPVVLLTMQFLDMPPARTTNLVILVTWIVWVALVAISVRGAVLRHIRTLGNLIETAQQHDYSMKASGTREPGELAVLYRQLNALMESLKLERQGEQQLAGILEKVISQINVAIIVGDSRDCVLLANLRACKLLGASSQALIGTELASTPLAQIPLEDRPRLLNHRFPGGEGRWQISQQHYRHQGKQSRIIFITDLQHILYNEELSAWQRLIRVIGHEVNNSLTPIISLCQTISSILERPDRAEYANDVRECLGVVSSRAKGLKGFITAYARIARLPEPDKTLFPAARLVTRVQGIFAPGTVKIVSSIAEVMLFGDPVQLEQALINLVRNALQAQGDDSEAISFSCSVQNDHCEFCITDSGTGISNQANLFVPFYTTKHDGAGIGLVLCRQIAASHYGQVTVENRSDARGAVAKLILPLPPP
jgi:two-component system nitrogen regulation sensor histidine kinase NtrY